MKTGNSKLLRKMWSNGAKTGLSEPEGKIAWLHNLRAMISATKYMDGNLLGRGSGRPGCKASIADWICQGLFCKKFLDLTKCPRCKCNNLSLLSVFAKRVRNIICNFVNNLGPDKLDARILHPTAHPKK